MKLKRKCSYSLNRTTGQFTGVDTLLIPRLALAGSDYSPCGERELNPTPEAAIPPGTLKHAG
jgi:hypothetical protein